MTSFASTAHCAAAVSVHSDALTALEEVCGEAMSALQAPPHLAFLFLSPHHLHAAGSVAERAQRRLNAECLVGCTAEAVAGPGREIEQQPGLSLWLGHFPGAHLRPMHLSYATTAEGGSFAGWPDDLPAEWPHGAGLILLGDPFSFPVDLLLDRLNEDQPVSVVVGGMASAAAQPGGNRLLLGDALYDHGAIAIYVQGAVRLRTVVSQGCRPIGDPFVITQAYGNTVYQLGGTAAHQRLNEVYQTLATREREMLQRGVHLGRVVNEYQERFEQGDFLVRNVMGVDADRGGLVIGDHVRAGQTVQFHVRDAETADAELRQLLSRAKAASGAPPAGALLFTCNGRGSRLFAQPHHDVAAIEQILGGVPVAGFFAAGEVGPIGGKSFLHGFTASIALFDAPVASAAESWPRGGETSP